MSSFAESVTKKMQEPKTPRCKLMGVYDSMDKVDQEALSYAINMVRSGDATNAWLVSTLTSNGFSIGKTAVGDHLREVCACVRS